MKRRGQEIKISGAITGSGPFAFAQYRPFDILRTSFHISHSRNGCETIRNEIRNGARLRNKIYEEMGMGNGARLRYNKITGSG